MKFGVCRDTTVVFAAILPEGRQTADSGFILVTTALGMGGYVEFVAKTTNSSGTTSPATWYPLLPRSLQLNLPIVQHILPLHPIRCQTPLGLFLYPNHFSNYSHRFASLLGHCFCTAPANPTTSSAAPSTICSGASSTITGSGAGGSAT